MSVGQRYNLLKNHFSPPSDFMFPQTFEAGCNRSFNFKWLKELPGLVYSTSLDGAYCLPCALFANQSGIIVNKPFQTWHRKSDKLYLILKRNITLILLLYTRY